MPRHTSQPPAKFHYIWLGCDIPEAYLRNIKTIASVAKQAGVEVNIWVDKPSNYHHVVERDPTLRIYGLRLRSVGTLPELLAQTNEEDRFAYDANANKLTNAQLTNLLTYAQHECVGLANFAAASDIYRLLILYVEGGYYFDTDLTPRCPLTRENKEFELPVAEQGFQILAIPPDSTIDRPGFIINAAVSACPQHEIIIDSLIRVNKNYTILYRKAKEHGADFSGGPVESEDIGFIDYGEQKPKYDLLAKKRLPGGLDSPRRHLTEDVSGPGVYWDSIVTYCIEYNIEHPMKQNSPLKFPLSSTNEDLQTELGTIAFGKVGYELKCDNSWLNPSDKKKKGFEI